MKYKNVEVTAEKEEHDDLRELGYVVIGENGGGYYGSYYIYAKPQNEEEKEEVDRKHKEFLEYINGLRR